MVIFHGYVSLPEGNPRTGNPEKKTIRMIHGMIGWDLFRTAQIGIVWFI